MDHNFFEMTERYLAGKLNEEERKAFEQELQQDAGARSAFDAHTLFLTELKKYGERVDLQDRLDQIHSSLDVREIMRNATPHESVVVKLWNRYKINSLVAASVAILAVLSTLWATGYFSKLKDNSSQYVALRRDMNNIQRNVKAQNVLIKNMNESQNKMAPSHYGATGFALSSDGYIVTTYHVIKDADSVYVQNNLGSSYKVDVLYTDPAYDIALLKVTDPSFTPMAQTPYTFKSQAADIGEDVFTLGFPREEAVYGRGYLSSSTGYSGDTIAYQVSIPVNPGNSGGPVFDTRGNIIGVINSKQKETDGAAFAIKSNYLLKVLSEIPEDQLSEKIAINKKNMLGNLSRTDQLKKVQDYIFMVKVY